MLNYKKNIVVVFKKKTNKIKSNNQYFNYSLFSVPSTTNQFKKNKNNSFMLNMNHTLQGMP